MSNRITLVGFTAVFLFSHSYSDSPLGCGERHKVKRPYGRIEVRVDCDTKYNRKTVCEYKGEEILGSCETYVLPSGWRRDSSFYRNHATIGTSKVWDSLGNVLALRHYWKGHEVGHYEGFFRPGVPSSVKNWDSLGRKQGLQQEWWPNGNKKSEMVARNDRMMSGTEYYENGKPRHWFDCGTDTTTSIFGKQCANKENWAPDGRSSGKVVGGNGEMLLFSADSVQRKRGAYHEVYKDTLLAATEDLDSAAAARWLDIYIKTGKPPTTGH